MKVFAHLPIIIRYGFARLLLLLLLEFPIKPLGQIHNNNRKLEFFSLNHATEFLKKLIQTLFLLIAACIEYVTQYVLCTTLCFNLMLIIIIRLEIGLIYFCDKRVVEETELVNKNNFLILILYSRRQGINN